MQVIDLRNARNILVVAPHADDETLGCAGLLLKYKDITDVLLLTDGRKGYPNGESVDEMALAAQREEEFAEAMSFAGVRNTMLLRIPDKQVYENRRIIQRVDVRKYEFIFVPNRNENHMDHRFAYNIFQKIIKKQKAKARLVEYEVWTPLAEPNYMLDISEQIENKHQMLFKYKSQLRARDYLRLCDGLAMYRGALCKAAYVENYYEEPCVSTVKRLVRKLPVSFRRYVAYLRGRA